MQLLTGWGRTAATRATVQRPASAAEVVDAVTKSDGPLIARGLGRSYNDAAQIAGGTVLDLTGLDAVEQLAPDTGRVTAGAGLSIDRLLRYVLPHGWFVPVTPGTRQVTLGGALAGDVHGKNHHVDGSMADHVTHADLVLPDGSMRRVAPGSVPKKGSDLFWETAGGMGLTGILTSVGLQLVPVSSSQVLVDTDRAHNLEHLLSLLGEDDPENPYSVAWIDLVSRGAQMGRGVVTRGRHATRDDLPIDQRSSALAFNPRTLLATPPLFPSGLLNRVTVRAFNEAWYRKAPERRRDELQTITAFFHPLDGVAGWNRVYGPRGFLQYQLAVPDDGVQAIVDTVELISGSGTASFLAVLKRFGPGNPGWLSFPIEGWTLALDLPNVAGLAPLLDQLDELVLSVGGRVNLTKDARVDPARMREMYPRLQDFISLRETLDPSGRLASDLARRLHI